MSEIKSVNCGNCGNYASPAIKPKCGKGEETQEAQVDKFTPTSGNDCAGTYDLKMMCMPRNPADGYDGNVGGLPDKPEEKKAGPLPQPEIPGPDDF